MISRVSFILILFSFQVCISQGIDHWETAVRADGIWRYIPGTAEPAASWKNDGYDDSSWSSGQGGIGYGDGDDLTVISPTVSLYMRMTFTVVDTGLINGLLLHADYDDAFVAYLNGVEIARSNIGAPGFIPAYNDPADGFHEAVLYSGGLPEVFFVSAALLKNGTNTFAVQVHNENISSSDLSSLFWLSAGIADASTLYGPTPSWFFTPTFSSDLLLISINTFGQEIVNEPKINVQIGIADQTINSAFGPFDVYEGSAGIEIRGSSSSLFEKKGFGLEFTDSTGNPLNVAIPGFPADDDWILHGPYSDKSLIRNALAFHVARQIEPWAPRTRFCEFWINGDYRGVYLLIEKIKIQNNRLDLADLLPTDISGDQLTGGYIVAVDRDEGPDNGWWSPFNSPPHYMEFKDPRGEVLNSIQKSYIENYVTEFETALFGPNFLDSILGYKAWADQESFVDHLILREFGNDVDAYRLSTFMHKDKDSKGGKLKMGPLWDCNLSFGNVDYCDNSSFTAGWAFNSDDLCGAPQPFWWDRLLQDTTFENTWKCRWTSLREGPLSSENLTAVIDSLEILLSQAAEQNFDRWNVLGTYVWPNFFVGSTWEEELVWLRNWIEDRLFWMDLNTPGTCRISEPVSGIANPEITEPTCYPNPFSTSVYFTNLPECGGRIFIYGASGQLLNQFEFDTGTHSWTNELDVSGPVLLKIVSKEGHHFTKRLLSN